MTGDSAVPKARFSRWDRSEAGSLGEAELYKMGLEQGDREAYPRAGF
jgi:hypothetical protein